MITAVVDTNVLASGFLRPLKTSPPVQILDAWRLGLYTLIVSGHILTELVRTLADPYFRRHVSGDQAVRLLALLQRRAILTDMTSDVHGVATHPEDDLILATAVSAKANYLVTGDAKLQRLRHYQGVAIVSPREFLEILQSQAQG
jgi:putative PIN family toxin of toxin-antitoxin system